MSTDSNGPQMPAKVPRPPASTYAVRPRGTSTARGYGAAHRRLRRLVLAEVPICEMCDRAWAAHMHHIDGVVSHTDRANLQALCPHCHMSLHAGGGS